eukprot:2475572-Pleurochrysis_carterae.AAC.1
MRLSTSTHACRFLCVRRSSIVHFSSQAHCAAFQSLQGNLRANRCEQVSDFLFTCAPSLLDAKRFVHFHKGCRTRIIFARTLAPTFARIRLCVRCAVSQVFNQLGDTPPDVEEPQLLAKAFTTVQSLLRQKKLLSGALLCAQAHQHISTWAHTNQHTRASTHEHTTT